MYKYRLTTGQSLPAINWQTYGAGYLHGIALQNQTLIDFERDKLYRETGRQLAGTTISRSYDSQMRLNRIWAHNENMAQAINRQHHYDPVGQLIQIETGQGKHHYRYDSARRIFERELLVYDRYDGRNLDELARAYGASERTIRNCVARVCQRMARSPRWAAG